MAEAIRTRGRGRNRKWRKITENGDKGYKMGEEIKKAINNGFKGRYRAYARIGGNRK